MIYMKININEPERIVRIIIGFSILAIGIYYQNLLGLIGLEIVLAGILGWSPLYKLFHISTEIPSTRQGNMA